MSTDGLRDVIEAELQRQSIHLPDRYSDWIDYDALMRKITEVSDE